MKKRRLRAVYKPAMALGCDCKSCPLSAPPQQGPVLPEPPKQCKMIVAGEGPGPSEETYGKYFIGPSGDFLNNALARWNIPREDLHIANVTMCRPRRELGDGEWAKAIECCKPRLVSELEKTRCKTVLALGGRAFQALTGIKSTKQRHYQGMPYPGADPFEKYKVVTAYHPAHVLRPENGSFVPSVWEFIGRAWAVARGKFHVQRWPKILIHPDEEALEALESIAKSREPVGFDVETRGTDPLSSLCMCLGIATEKVSVSIPWEAYTAGRFGFVESLDSYQLGKRLARVVSRILSGNPLVLQNGPHDLLTAGRLGLVDIEKAHYAFDTLLAHAVVAQGVWHDLGYIAALETRLPRWKTEFHATTHEKGLDAFAKRHPERLRTYNAKDAWVTLLLRAYLEPRLDETPAGWKIFRQHMENMHIAMLMERTGVPWDSERAKKHLKVLRPRYRRARNQLQNLAAAFGIENFNPNSPAQVSSLFYGKMQARVKYRSKKTGAPSSDEKALSDMVTHPNEFVREGARAMLRYRKNEKLLAYLGWSKKGGEDVRIAADGRMHITWNPQGARTGRWSSSPNLQNIPKPVRKKIKHGPRKGEWRVVAPGLRDVFLPLRPGDWVVCGDYDQLEMRIAALVTEDEDLIELFRAGGDPHAENAAAMFGYDSPDKVSKDERDMAKIWYYQRMNDGSPEAIWKHVAIDFPNYTLKESYRNRDAYDAAHPMLARWHHDEFKRAREERCVRTPISGLTLPFFSRVEKSKVYSYNIQGAAADILNPRIKPVADAMDWVRTAILGQVHDELVVCGPDPVWLAELLQKELSCEITINGRTLLFTVGIKMGPSYGEVEEIKKGESFKSGARRIKKLYKERFASLKRWQPQSRRGTA